MCFKFFNKKIKKYKWEDIGFIKLGVFFFTLFLVKMFPKLLSFDWYVYLVLFVLFAIYPAIRLFK